jgi:hypothetical protein
MTAWLPQLAGDFFDLLEMSHNNTREFTRGAGGDPRLQIASDLLSREQFVTLGSCAALDRPAQ